MPEAMYRFFDREGSLLYIGITNKVGRRLHEHNDRKPWFTDVVRAEFDHYPDRGSVVIAERNAIRSEHPRYNIQHNRRSGAPDLAPGQHEFWHAYPEYEFRSRRSDYRKTSRLWLYPEIDCSSMVDEYWDLDGTGQLYAFVEYIRRNYSDEWENDAVPILWTVSGDQGIAEFAPFAVRSDHSDWWGRDFLSEFTWPENTATGEPIDWFRTPVVNYRFPAFAEALGWLPSAFQEFCPLRSIMASREQIMPELTVRHIRREIESWNRRRSR